MEAHEIQIILLAIFIAMVITVTDILLVRAYNRDLKEIKELLKNDKNVKSV